MMRELEPVWRDRERAREIGLAGAAFMSRFTCADQIDRLLGLIEPAARGGFVRRTL